MNRLADAVAATTSWQEARTGGVAVAAALEAATRAPTNVVESLRAADEVVFAGAGSSLYLAEAVSWAFREMTARAAPRSAARFEAVPVSELLLRREAVLGARDRGRRAVVLFSRSGSTSETVAAAEEAGRRGDATLAVTCRGESPLAGAAAATLVSPAGDEAAIVMTRSFTSMLALGIRLAAVVAGDERVGAQLDALPAAWSETERPIETAWELAAQAWSRVIVLGGGAARPIATEAVLKLTETSQIASAAYEPLEFRHGPIGVCEEGVLVVGLVGGPGADEEARVLDEARALGARIWPLDPTADGTLHHLAGLPLLLPPLQAFALGQAITRGRDPDRPRHLSKVVLLDAPPGSGAGGD